MAKKTVSITEETHEKLVQLAAELVKLSGVRTTLGDAVHFAVTEARESGRVSASSRLSVSG